MWFNGLFTWIFSIFIDKAADDIADATREHIEPEEGDWDWSKSPDANPDVQEVNLVAKEAKVSLFLAEVEKLVTRGFGSPQILVLMTKIDKLSPGQHWFVEFNVKAFDRGSPLNLFVQRLDFEHVGFIIQSDSALSFEIANLASEYDQSDKEVSPPATGLN